MKDLEELGRLRELGLLTDEEFETARLEIFSQRPTANEPANGDRANPEDPEDWVEEGEVASPSELDIVASNDGTTTSSSGNWWQASDGQWYPPEALHLIYDQGWRRESDGNWIPPSEHDAVPSPTAAGPVSQPTLVSRGDAPPDITSSSTPTQQVSVLEEEVPPKVHTYARPSRFTRTAPAATATTGHETAVGRRKAPRGARSSQAAFTTRSKNRRPVIVASLTLFAAVVLALFALSPSEVADTNEFKEMVKAKSSLLRDVEQLEQRVGEQSDLLETSAIKHDQTLRQLALDLDLLEAQIKEIEERRRNQDRALQDMRLDS